VGIWGEWNSVTRVGIERDLSGMRDSWVNFVCQVSSILGSCVKDLLNLAIAYGFTQGLAYGSLRFSLCSLPLLCWIC